MENTLQKFNNFLDVAKAYQSSPMIYMFIRECAFRCAFDAMQKGLCNENDKQRITNLYNQFQMETTQYNWNIKNLPKEDYSKFLEFFYSQIDFETAPANLLTICKDLTENLVYFGPLDDLAQRRSKQ